MLWFFPKSAGTSVAWNLNTNYLQQTRRHMFTFYFMFTLSAFDWKASRCIYRSFIQISYTDFNTRFVQFTSFFPHIQFRSSSRWYHPVAVFTIEADREDIGAYSTLMNYLLSAFSVVKINKLRKIVYIRVI